MAKQRIPIPQSVAAEILFLADRTCCVCRNRTKPVQLHHIDDDPTNNAPENLATLCLECHRDTHVSGGFDRKLDAEQIILYRDDWNRAVAARRAPHDQAIDSTSRSKGEVNVKYATSVAEAYKDREEWVLLAVHYNHIGNEDLRDKYIDIALAEDPRDGTVVFLRGLQGRPDLIPSEVVNRELRRLTEHASWNQRARFFMKLKRYRDASQDYVRGVLQSLEEDNPFSAAFYLRELVKHDLIKAMYVEALQKAADEDDLWWQVRALQDLGWERELDSLLLSNAGRIEASKDLMLQQLLTQARGDSDRALDESIEIWSSARYGIAGDDDEDEQEIVKDT
ncbi:MAG TPA: HNH endonuclease signature motif containing protein [Solirubrobacterales bacterium]|nr:HNH endonuclease signature motif containing protein [Solirubrobacterales bacterium]